MNLKWSEHLSKFKCLNLERVSNNVAAMGILNYRYIILHWEGHKLAGAYQSIQIRGFRVQVWLPFTARCDIYIII